MPLEGGCRCGRVRYSLDYAQLPAIYACHCLYCQTMTGSICVLQAPIPTSRYTLLPHSAELDAKQELYTDYHFHRSDGAISTQRFCSVCKTRIYNSRTNRPANQIYLRAGTIDTSAGLKPIYHIMTDDKQDWVAIPQAGGVEAFEGELPDDKRAQIVKMNEEAARADDS